MISFPKIVIDLQKVTENVITISTEAAKKNTTISAVIKGVNGLPQITDAIIKGGITSIASSRLPQLEQVKKEHPEIETLMLRIPMLSELEQLIQCADISLNSELVTLKALNEVAQKNDLQHKVILMVDLGDLREGFFKDKELLEVASFVENECSHLYLSGIGTNLGCYGSIQPDTTNLGKLVELSHQIEQNINRKLDIVSGGASTTVPMILDGSLPTGINHLRIGDSIFLRDMETFFDFTFDAMHGDVFTIHAEIIEIKEKPSYPIGNISVDAFGNKNEYIDRGTQKRALLAIGKQDLGDVTKLIPYDKDIQLIGGSSDHTIIDITDTSQKYKIGDILTFNIEYELLLYSTESPYIYKEFVKNGGY